SPTQLDLATPAGSSTGADVSVTNDGASTETIRARLRRLDGQLSHQQADVPLNAATDPTFINERGVPQAFKEIKFTLPAGADRLDASIAYPGPASTVNLTLFDPAGRFTAFT